MNIIERVKNILLTPKTEWEVINNESATPTSLLTSYVLPLALVGSIGSILGALLMAEGKGLTYGIAMLVVTLIVSVLGYFLSVLIIDALAPSFSSEKDAGKTAQLVAYSSTPSYIAGLLSFIPILGAIISLAAWVYGIYTMYLGLGPIKKTPEDKKVGFLLVSYLIIIVIYFALMAVLGGIVLISILGGVGGVNSLTR